MSETTGKASKAKAKKRYDGPTKPKRPKSAYNFYFKARRLQILEEAKSRGEESPEFEDIGRTIGELWQHTKTDEEGVAQYNELAQADSVRYKAEMEKYYQDELLFLQKAEADERHENNNGFPGNPNAAHASQQYAMNSQHMLGTPSSASSASAGLNSYIQGGATSLGTPMASSNAMVFRQLQEAATRDAQVLQLASSSAPGEAIAQLLQAQFESMQHRQQMLVEEVTSLQAKIRLAGTLLGKETSAEPQQQQQQQPQQVQDGVLGGNAGLIGQQSIQNQPVQNQPVQNQLAQLLQLLSQAQGVNTNTGAASVRQSLGNQAQVPANTANIGLSIESLQSLIGGQAQAQGRSSNNLGNSVASLLGGAQMPTVSAPAAPSAIHTEGATVQELLLRIMNEQQTRPPG